MFSLTNPRTRSIIILSLTTLIAGGVWGIYVWRFASPHSNTISADASGSGNTQRLTPLRASRTPAPSPTSDDAALDDSDKPQDGLAASVRVNSPPSMDSVVEMSLKSSAKTTPVAEAVAPAPSLSASVAAAKAARSRGDVLGARTNLVAALGAAASPLEQAAIRTELLDLADALIFSKATNVPDPLTSMHTVQTGDSLYALAQPNKVTEQLLAKLNNITDPNRLYVGQRLKVIHGPFRAVISKSAHRMDIYLREVLVESFNVGLGANGNTPTGTWLINGKLENPDWTDPVSGHYYLADDPANPIGERWLGLEGIGGAASARTGFGIHGTIDADSIGQNMSMGCIRLRADDIVTVYDLLVDRYSEVAVVE